MIELLQKRLEIYKLERAAAQDVERFLNSAERKSLSLWSEKFFRAKVDQLSDLMKSP